MRERGNVLCLPPVVTTFAGDFRLVLDAGSCRRVRSRCRIRDERAAATATPPALA